jgi:hypothetical protein
MLGAVRVEPQFIALLETIGHPYIATVITPAAPVIA